MNERNRQLRQLKMNAEYYRLKSSKCPTTQCSQHFQKIAELLDSKREELLKEEE